MRILSILFFLISLSLFGQNRLTPDVATVFVHSKINELNIKIWNGVRNNKLRAYKNDSLREVLSNSTIDRQIQFDFTVMVPNPDNPNDPYDLIAKSVIYNFDTIGGYSGMLLAYDYKFESKLSLQLKAISPVSEPLNETGPDFIRSPFFWILVDDLKVFLGEDWVLYKSLIRMRTTVLDFKRVKFSPNYPRLDKENYIVDQTVNTDLAFQDFGAEQDTTIGSYLSDKIIEVLDNGYEDIAFYKDVSLTTLYPNIDVVLDDSMVIKVPNPDNPDDPYDLIDEFIDWKHKFDDLGQLLVFRNNEQLVLQLRKPEATHWSTGRATTSNEKAIYFSYSSIKHLLQPHDRIVLEALLEEIAE